MKKITLIDYYGNCDALGRSIGHSPKVLNEYGSLLREEYLVETILPKCIKEEVDDSLFYRIHDLPYQIMEEGSRGIGKRIFDKIKLFINISRALQLAESSVLWFYRTDFFLFLYLYLHRKPKEKKLFCLVYQQKFSEGALGRFLNRIYQRGIQKFDGVIYAQKNMKPEHEHTLYMPDYYYDSEKYESYLNCHKKEKVVCLGTMTPYKKLEEIIDIFNRSKLHLDIIGKFYSEERFIKLKRRAKNHILIENTILREENYYKKMAEAQYTILPYDMRQYTGRTSGVLIEALFMQTIPIAPNALLVENRIPGIGYEDLKELENIDLFEKNRQKISDELSRKLQSYPRKDDVQRDLVNFINSYSKT